MLVQEDGPFNVFRRLREVWGIGHDDTGCVFEVPDRLLAKLFSCLWCMSVWVAPAVWGIWIVAPVVVWILAISTGAIIVDRIAS